MVSGAVIGTPPISCDSMSGSRIKATTSSASASTKRLLPRRRSARLAAPTRTAGTSAAKGGTGAPCPLTSGRARPPSLAARGFVAIYPVTGWWKELPARDQSEIGARYALLISIETPVDEVDIWTPVAIEARSASHRGGDIDPRTFGPSSPMTLIDVQYDVDACSSP